MSKLTPFLMFEGQAAKAIQLYTSIFKNSEIISMKKYGDSQPGKEEQIENALISINGQQIIFYDSVIHHNFTFTPSISFFAEFDTEQELDAVFHRLSEGGMVLMPLESYPFSKKFGWVQDQFGVSWQLTLK